MLDNISEWEQIYRAAVLEPSLGRIERAITVLCSRLQQVQQSEQDTEERRQLEYAIRMLNLLHANVLRSGIARRGDHIRMQSAVAAA
jgi:hypothetical protein